MEKCMKINMVGLAGIFAGTLFIAGSLVSHSAKAATVVVSPNPFVPNVVVTQPNYRGYGYRTGWYYGRPGYYNNGRYYGNRYGTTYRNGYRGGTVYHHGTTYHNNGNVYHRGGTAYRR